MPDQTSPRFVERPVEVTALLVDLRNFTPLLNASGRDANDVNTFCYFLADFYSTCLDACLLALPLPLRNDPPFYVNSTGDGVLVVFEGEWHFGYGFLSAILLDSSLSRLCAPSAGRAEQTGLLTSFGIGVESGTASRIFAQGAKRQARPVIETYIGNCINVAARCEAVSKMLFEANSVVSDSTVEQVAQALFQENFEEKRQREAACTSDKERRAIHKLMNALNHKLCLSYINRHVLKGVEQSVPLYRLARSALKPGIPRFDKLVRQLVRGKVEHFTEVIETLSR